MRMTNLCTYLFLCNFVLIRVFKYPPFGDLYQTFEFFSHADLVGMGIGCLFFQMLGFKKGVGLCLVLTLLSATSIMYLEDRNIEFMSMPNPHWIRLAERR